MQNHRAAIGAAQLTILPGKRHVAIRTAQRQGSARSKGANTTNLLGFVACQFPVRRAALPFLGLLLRDVLYCGSAI
jgi:hypothetical protein